MKGLLLKDWYEIRYQYRWFLILLAVAGFSSATGQGNAVFWGCYMMILVAMIPLNTMGYDEKSGWQKYSRCFPVSSGHLVLEKYLLGVIALIVAVGVYLLFSAYGPDASAEYPVWNGKSKSISHFLYHYCGSCSGRDFRRSRRPSYDR